MLLCMTVQAQEQKRFIREIRFTGATALSQTELQNIKDEFAKRMADSSTDASNQQLIRELQQRATDQLQSRGYFTATVRARITPLSDQPFGARLLFNVEQGLQYKVGSVTFKNAKTFSAQQLLAVFPLRPGEIFKTNDVRAGLENVRRIYANLGYIKCAPVPLTDVDQVSRTINLTIDLDEGFRYRVEKVTVLGLNRELSERIWQELRGTYFRDDSIRRVAEKYIKQKQLSLCGIEIHPQDDRHTVSIEFDARPFCRQNSFLADSN